MVENATVGHENRTLATLQAYSPTLLGFKRIDWAQQGENPEELTLQQLIIPGEDPTQYEVYDGARIDLPITFPESNTPMSIPSTLQWHGSLTERKILP